jgi:hypothetical protein
MEVVFSEDELPLYGFLGSSDLPSAGLSLGYPGIDLNKGRQWAIGPAM